MSILVRAGDRTLGIAGGLIVEPTGSFDVELSVPDGEMMPGLINAHDHLHRNHYGRLGRPPYPNAYAWGQDIHANDAAAIHEGRSVPRREALLAGAWKNLLAGVTTVVHHDPWEPDFGPGFPVRLIRVRTAHSWGQDEAALAREARPPREGRRPLTVHVAEGVDAAAAEEVRRLDEAGLLDTDLLAVHVVGVDDDGIRRFRRSNAALVWCPTSNHFLFGRTAPAELLAPGVDVLLGSDSLLTADGDLLDEIRAARALRLVDDDRLLDAVGSTAARRLGLPEPSLAIGAPADLVVLRRPVLEASRRDVALVIAGGCVRVAAPDVGGIERLSMRSVPGPAGETRLISSSAGFPLTRIQTTHSYYDTIADDYDATMDDDPRHRPLRAAFQDFVACRVPEDALLLDFGCGTGIDAAEWVSRGLRVIAYEPSPAMARRTRDRCRDAIRRHRVRVVEGPIEDLEAALGDSGPVDAVVADFAVLNLVPDLGHVLTVLGGALRPGGKVLAMVQNPFYPRDMAAAWWWRALADLRATGAIRSDSPRGTTRRYVDSAFERVEPPRLRVTERRGWWRGRVRSGPPLSRLGHMRFLAMERTG